MLKRFLITTSIIFLSLASFVFVSAQVATSSPPVAGSVDCMRVGVEKREAAMQESFNVYVQAINEDLSTRRSDLGDAFKISDDNTRNEAIKNAWNKFKESRKTAVKVFNQTRDNIWKQFDTEMKGCNMSYNRGEKGLDLKF